MLGSPIQIGLGCVGMNGSLAEQTCPASHMMPDDVPSSTPNVISTPSSSATGSTAKQKHPISPHDLITKKSGNRFRVGVFLDFVSSAPRTEGPHGCVTHHTCRRADGIELTAIGVKLSASRCEKER